MTHKELIKESVCWLKRKQHYIIITEMVSGAGEQADAIGWKGTGSTLIECKASKTDYKADNKKSYRHFGEDNGMGNYRYYFIPKGLNISLDSKWGVIEFDGRVCRVIKKAEYCKADLDRERQLLLSAIRRIGENSPSGISVKCYAYQTKCNAEIHIEED